MEFPLPSPTPSLQARTSRTATRGDVAILYTFYTLMIIVVSALVIGVVTITTIQRSQDIALTAQAFYAADTGIERGLFDYIWDANGTGDPPTCTVASDVSLFGGGDPRYDVTVSGDPWSTGLCPSLSELAGGRAVCLTAFGYAKHGTIKRRIDNDTNATACRLAPP